MSNIHKLMQGKKVSVRKKRAKETKPREQGEARFRVEVVRWLKKKGYYYKRIENGVCGLHGVGVPDFLFFNRRYFYWLELKFGVGILSKEQIVFKEHCIRSGINHITAYTIKDIEDAINQSPRHIR